MAKVKQTGGICAFNGLTFRRIFVIYGAHVESMRAKYETADAIFA